jgi:TolB-like protein/tRNA A-37 threonylcarbamoyl transferase component Bud32/Tfp pilus assembly protein PilF
MIGKTMSHYRIIEKLGEGGMGVVYKAEDTKLHRPVALKFLHPELTRDDEAKTRFMHEAQAAAALNHPHICTIYEVGENEGQSFIAMELVEGESLKERIERGPLPIDDAVSLAVQVGEGLGEAHEKGIVHRDIKPGNIMLTARGQAKILDFGLARLGADMKLTKADTTLGTAAYMSPEQTSGKDVDRRTDIWSLGVVLYEMITGRRPFTGDYEAGVVHSILNDAPEPLTARRSNVPMELERIIGKALAKNSSERYPHVEDMLVDLRALRSTTQTHRPPQHAKGLGTKGKVAIAGGAAVVIIAIILAIKYGLFAPDGQPQGKHGTDNRKMLVVLPFENLGAPEDEYFANGTTDAITARLAGVSGFGVISRQSAIQYRKSAKSIKQIGEELGVDYILEGTVQRERPGDPTSRVRVIPQLIRVADDTHVWADTYDEDMTQVFQVQSDIAERVATQLDVALLEPERRAIEKRPTENLAAYEAYLRGMDYFYRQGNVTDSEQAVQLFRKTVSLDPRFAEAWAMLAKAYHDLYWVYDRPGALTLETEAAKRAEQLAPDIPETHLALGVVAYAHREYDRALKHFEMAQRLRPSGDALLNIGWVLRRTGKWQEALNHFKDACRLIPRSYHIYADPLGLTNTYIRRFDEAEQDFNQAISLAPNMTQAYVGKAFCLLARNGDVGAARRVMLEMSRRANMAEAAEIVVTNGLQHTPDLRLFTETYTEAFDAFEQGPVERYRRIQPAVIAATHLDRALLIEATEGRQSASARYDSARVHFERIIQSNPQSGFVCYYHAYLGLAYAGLGRREEAIREGKEAVRIMPISKDALMGPELINYLAEINMRCGEYETAIDQLETLLSLPGFYMSANILRLDPLWNPIRSNPRFKRLVEGH